ncbi:MAG: leucine-rich repeat domain-containing protein [Ruminococcus sp.]|nr:leucine-rich repeat domain-containing protein [Ruminococcus sp.]
MTVLKVFLIIIGAAVVMMMLSVLYSYFSVYCKLHGISHDHRPKIRRKYIRIAAKFSKSIVTENGTFYLTNNGTRIFCFKTNTERVEIEIPAGLEIIGDMAFCGCKVEEVVLSRGIRSIGKRAFDKCGVKKLRLPDTDISIGDGAFAQSEIRELYICGSHIFKDYDSKFEPREIIQLRKMMLTGVMDNSLNEKLLAQAAVNIFARTGSPEAEAFAKDHAKLICKTLFDHNCLKEVDDLLKIKISKELSIKMTEYARKNGMNELFVMMEKYRYDNDYFDDSAADKFDL